MARNPTQGSASPTRVIAILAILILGAASTAILPGCSRSSTRKEQAKPRAAVRTERPRKSQAQLSWERLVAGAKQRCHESGNVSVDFDAFHEYAGQGFGVMSVAWKDSEYEVDLFRYNPNKKDWETSPVIDQTWNMVDVPATSKRWGVPEKVIQSWIDEVDKAVRRKYRSE
ncbi:MAG TPA: hypothetical protein VMX94_12390 [Armatimonadota bacterium]|nr:hypothetical protein [Armatimonadota bacterium]